MYWLKTDKKYTTKQIIYLGWTMQYTMVYYMQNTTTWNVTLVAKIYNNTKPIRYCHLLFWIKIKGEECACLTSFSIMLQLYTCDQFYWWRNPEYPEKATDLPQWLMTNQKPLGQIHCTNTYLCQPRWYRAP